MKILPFDCVQVCFFRKKCQNVANKKYHDRPPPPPPLELFFRNSITISQSITVGIAALNENMKGIFFSLRREGI
jgi:hypothetical protein